MRIDGWKAIGAHFGRERSTVIRWASERGMPVYRIPGPGRGSVYAFTEELDAWLEADRPDSPQHDAPPAAAPETMPENADLAASPAMVAAPIATPRRWYRASLLAAGLLAAVSLSAWAFNREAAPREQLLLPADPELADTYLEARSDWAARNPQSIAAAIAKLQQVVAADPGFAPAYAALADSYVLAREFGSLDDTVAFARAQSAADTALRIDPDNADALRAAGFLEYWWRGDGVAAARRFRAAIAAAPPSAQSHFWFGNVLVDNGDFAEGMAELERARLLEPASVPLQADIAWARWSMGDEDRGRRELEALRQRQPDLATVRDYLSVIYLADGDMAGFVEEIAAQARIRDLPDESAFAARLQEALARDPASVPQVMLAQLEADLASGARSSLPWPVFVATAAGDRPAVLRLVQMGQARGDKWGSAGLRRTIAEKWTGDATITAALADLAAPSLVQQRR